MFFLNLFGVSAIFFNDLLATISVIGCFLMLLGSLSSKGFFTSLISLGEWSMAPLVFGSLFQVCFFLSGLAAETDSIGFVIPMSTDVVNGLFAVSILLVTAHWWLRKRNGIAPISRG